MLKVPGAPRSLKSVTIDTKVNSGTWDNATLEQLQGSVTTGPTLDLNMACVHKPVEKLPPELREKFSSTKA